MVLVCAEAASSLHMIDDIRYFSYESNVKEFLGSIRISISDKTLSSIKISKISFGPQLYLIPPPPSA